MGQQLCISVSSWWNQETIPTARGCLGKWEVQCDMTWDDDYEVLSTSHHPGHSHLKPNILGAWLFKTLVWSERVITLITKSYSWSRTQKSPKFDWKKIVSQPSAEVLQAPNPFTTLRSSHFLLFPMNTSRADDFWEQNGFLRNTPRKWQPVPRWPGDAELWSNIRCRLGTKMAPSRSDSASVACDIPTSVTLLWIRATAPTSRKGSAQGSQP